MKLRVVHLTSVHSPRDARIMKECTALAQAGWVVTLIAPHERNETVEGVQIVGFPRAKRRWVRFLISPLQVLRHAIGARAEVYHFHDPELIPIGAVLKVLGKTVVYDVHEDYPRAVLIKTWVAPFLRRLVSAFSSLLDRFAMAFVDLVVAATPPIASRFPADKTVVVRNMPVVEAFGCKEPVPWASRPPTVVYIGIISEARGVVDVIDALASLTPSSPVRLVLAGTFWPEDLEARMRARPGWERVDYVGWLSQLEIQQLLCRARVGIVTLHPTPSYVESYPTKLFEYMAAGLPVICSDFPLWRHFVEDGAAGVLVDPRDPRAIAGAIEHVMDSVEVSAAMGRKGSKLVRELYTWRNEAARLVRSYEELSR